MARTTEMAVLPLVLCAVLATGCGAHQRARTGALSDGDGGKLQVMYGDVLVSGQMLGKDQTSKAPHIAAPSASEMHLYTVIMYDPDAPSPSAPICKNWLHWIYTDAAGKHLTGGKQFVKYNGPTPPDGVHTYHIALYSQAAELMNAEPPSARCKFSPSEFAEQNGLTFIAEQTFKVAAGAA